METIPEGWMKQRIDDFLEKMVDPVKPEPDRMYREIGIRSHAKGIFHKEQVTGKSLGSKRVFKIHADCFVVNIVFAWEQAIALTSDQELGMIASHRFPMFRPKENRCDVNYITYYFKTPHGKYLLGLASPGGAGRNKTLGQSEFARLELILPPQQEQKKIAKILSIWDRAIEVTEKLLKNSQQQKKSLMQQLLTGKKRLSGFSGEWKYGSFDILFKVSNDKKTQVKSNNYLDSGEVPVVDQGKKDIVGYTNNKTVYGDVPVIIFGDHTRIVKWIDFIFAPGADGTQVLKTMPIIDLKLGYYLILNTDIPSLGYSRHMRELKEKDFRYPLDKVEQQKIASVLSTADKETENIQQKLDCLRQEKKALMQQLLTGKRRVTL